MKRILCVGLALSMAVPAMADPLDLDDVPPSGGSARRGKGDFVILGVEQLPDFTVLIDRENLSKNYDLELKESFLPKISDALKKSPF